MKLKLFFSLLLAVAGVSLFAQKYPFGTEILNGGRVEPIKLTMVDSTNEHMNFCVAKNFSDN